MTTFRTIHRVRLHCAAAFVIFVAGASNVAAQSLEVTVTVDLAKILRLGTPAETIILGNPALASVTLSDSNTVVLSGKTVGVTNMIVLSEQGRTLAEYRLEVVPQVQELTTIYSGTARRTYKCGATCTPVLSTGDEEGHFAAAQGQISARTKGDAPQ